MALRWPEDAAEITPARVKSPGEFPLPSLPACTEGNRHVRHGRNALDGFAATEVIVITEDHEYANWSERGLTARIARLGLAVSRLSVPHEQVL